MTLNLAAMTDEELVGARNALQAVDDRIYGVVTRKTNRITVAIDAHECTSSMLAEAQAELNRRRKENST